MADMENWRAANLASQGIKVPNLDISKTKEFDKELEDLIVSKRANIKVVGVGGSGNNTINRMFEVGIKGAELIAINTDAADLLCNPADKKILIGKELTNGLGAGADPSIGEAAAKEQEQEIKEALQGADMVFICGGMGGGTGTGAAPVVAQVAKKLNALTISVVTLPFKAERKRRMEAALGGVERLRATSDTLITIPNEKLMSIAPRIAFAGCAQDSRRRSYERSEGHNGADNETRADKRRFRRRKKDNVQRRSSAHRQRGKRRKGQEARDRGGKSA